MGRFDRSAPHRSLQLAPWIESLLLAISHRGGARAVCGLTMARTPTSGSRGYKREAEASRRLGYSARAASIPSQWITRHACSAERRGDRAFAQVVEARARRLSRGVGAFTVNARWSCAVRPPRRSRLRWPASLNCKYEGQTPIFGAPGSSPGCRHRPLAQLKFPNKPVTIIRPYPGRADRTIPRAPSWASAGR